jgi:endoglucanase
MYRKFFVTVLALLLCALTATAQNNLPAMKRITDRNTPAHLAARSFMRGANIANYLEVPPGEHWGTPHTVADLKLIRAQGFDHIRLPVGWHHYTGPAPDFKISGEIFAKADQMVTNATALGLNVIINLHHFNEFTTDPAANTAWFHAIWRQVAAHYAGAPPGVAFELLNEPKDAATTVVLNPIFAQTIRDIRRTNPHRTLFVGPGLWNSPGELVNLRLPDDDQNIIVTLHCYDPMLFTHQGADWAGPEHRVTGIIFPGPPKTPLTPDPSLGLKSWVLNQIHQYNTLPTESNPSGPHAFLSKIQQAKKWSEEFGRPVHFGEFGAFTRADQESRVHYYAAFRQALDAAGIGWAIWDWKSGFNYWDPKTQQPLPGMREALFPEKAGKSPQ